MATIQESQQAMILQNYLGLILDDKKKQLINMLVSKYRFDPSGISLNEVMGLAGALAALEDIVTTTDKQIRSSLGKNIEVETNGG